MGDADRTQGHSCTSRVGRVGVSGEENRWEEELLDSVFGARGG